MSTEVEPLHFETKDDASVWLCDTGNTGVVVDGFPTGYIIVQFADDGVWAYVAADELVHLPDW